MVKNDVEIMGHYEQICSMNNSSHDVERISDVQKDPMFECRTCENNAGVAGILCTPNFFGT